MIGLPYFDLGLLNLIETLLRPGFVGNTEVRGRDIPSPRELNACRFSPKQTGRGEASSRLSDAVQAPWGQARLVRQRLEQRRGRPLGVSPWPATKSATRRPGSCLGHLVEEEVEYTAYAALSKERARPRACVTCSRCHASRRDPHFDVHLHSPGLPAALAPQTYWLQTRTASAAEEGCLEA